VSHGRSLATPTVAAGSVKPEREGEDEDEHPETEGTHAHPAIASGSCPAG
jgi:hypothetical protein